MREGRSCCGGCSGGLGTSVSREIGEIVMDGVLGSWDERPRGHHELGTGKAWCGSFFFPVGR